MRRLLPRSGPLAALALVAGLGVALSPAVHADEPAPPEADTNPSRYPPPSARPNLILIGGAVTVVWYGAAVGTSYLWPSSDGSEPLRYPVAGPWMALAETGCGSREPSCGLLDVIVRTLFTTLSAVGQAGGTIAMIEGVFVPTVGRPAPARSAVRPAATSWAVVAAPLGDSGAGFGVIGRF